MVTDERPRLTAELAGGRSLRQIFQAMNFRLVRETGLGALSIALFIAMLALRSPPVETARLLLEGFLPLSLGIIVLHALLTHLSCRPVRFACEAALSSRPSSAESHQAAVAQVTLLPWRMLWLGLSFGLLAWPLAGLIAHQSYGSAAGLLIGLGGSISICTTQILSYYRNKRVFLPLAEGIAERLSIDPAQLPQTRGALGTQVRAVLMLFAGSVAALGGGALALQLIERQAGNQEITMRIGLLVSLFCVAYGSLLAHELAGELDWSIHRAADYVEHLAQGDLAHAQTPVPMSEMAELLQVLRRAALGVHGRFRSIETRTLALERLLAGVGGLAGRLRQRFDAFQEAIRTQQAELRLFEEKCRKTLAELVTVEQRCEGHVLQSQELDTLAESLTPALNSLFASISTANSQLSQASRLLEQQDQAIESLVELAQDLTRQSGENAALVLRMRRLSEDAARVHSRVQSGAENGAASLRTRVEGLTSVQETISWASQSIGALGERSQEIGDILNIITAIAKQTNMLSLNAAIIAAQAGEHGPGFNIIADEIRALAEKTSSYTRRVGELVRGIVQGTGEAIDAMMICFDRLSTEMEASQATEQLMDVIAQGAQEAQELNKSMLDLTEREVETGTRARHLSDELGNRVVGIGRESKDLLAHLRVLSDLFSTHAGMLKTLVPTVAQQRSRAEALTNELSGTRNQARVSGRDLEQHSHEMFARLEDQDALRRQLAGGKQELDLLDADLDSLGGEARQIQERLAPSARGS